MNRVPNVGWVGIGKLGLTCALTLAHRGNVNVFAYDTSPIPESILRGETHPHQEEGIEKLIDQNMCARRVLPVKSLELLIQNVDLGGFVFVSTQTPHAREFGGERPVPEEVADFEYGYLHSVIRAIATEAKKQEKLVTIVVISTVLPGTSNKYIVPALNEYTDFIYNPYFIAMGTTVQDFVEPEFVLMGSTLSDAMHRLASIYGRVHNRPVRMMSVESAELTKVAYNTFISMKIVFANTLMEICQKTGADVDQVTRALQQADQRIASGRYMSGGMGDGGACHPRDNIAMSHLAERLDLSSDLFTFVTQAREQQSRYIADLAGHWADMTGLPLCICGVAYKPKSNLTYGSAALLLLSQLLTDGRDVSWSDPFVTQVDDEFTELRLSEPHEADDEARVFIIGMDHGSHWFDPIPGSVVIDPFGTYQDRAGVTVIRIGRKS